MLLSTPFGLEKYKAFPRLVASTDPAANVEISYTVPARTLIELTSVRFALVTDANAATRRVTLTIDDGTNVVAEIGSQVTQAASLTYQYTFGLLGPDRSSVAGTSVLQGLPAIVVQPGWRIKTVTASIQTTDNYGPAQIYGITYKA